MNGNIKFHKATSPAFNPGEVWVSCSGNKVSISKVRKYPGAVNNHTSDYSVFYWWIESGQVRTNEKDVWSFQVRYTHAADLNLKISGG